MSLKRFIVMSCLALLLPAMAQAQAGTTVSGKVVSGDGNPVQNASVFIEGMGLGALTDANGNYSFTVPGARATGQTANLTARGIGYTARTIRETLTPGGTITQNFTLTQNPLRLGEVVVTGAGMVSSVEKLGNVRNAVDSTLIRRSNETNIVNALAGKAPNVEVSSQSGEAGSSSYIRIRGARTINGTGQPLFVVDGQPIDNSTIATGDPTASTAAANRASDINPNDIESVEILKGAAAAAIYGSRAGQGVVLITTKSGRPGATKYSLRSTITQDKVNFDYPLQTEFGQGSGGNKAVCANVGCSLTSGSWGPLLAAGTPTFDHFAEMFTTGNLWENTLTASGGNDRTLFYLSGSRANQNGIIIGPHNFYDRTTVRLKASHRLTDRFNIGGNVSYIDDRGEYIQKGSNISGLLLGALRTPPEFNNANYLDSTFALGYFQHRSYRYPRPTVTSTSNPVPRGYDNPFFVVNDFSNTGAVGRTIGNINAQYNPMDWLSFQYTLGADYYADDRLAGFPLTSSGTGGIGAVDRATFTNLLIDHNLLGTARKDFSPSFAASLTLGQNLTSTHFKQLAASGLGLIAPQPFQLDNTVASNLSTDEFESLEHGQSYFAQGTADLWNQVFLTAGVRNDGISTFGKSQPRHWFPKASIAWNFTEAFKPFGNILPTGKLRLAYGETGQEPVVYSTLTGLTTGAFNDGYLSNGLSTTQNGIGGLITSATRGQENLGPERSKELEGGFDFQLFGNFSDLSFTAYNSKTVGVILLTPAAPSTGFLQQASNAGTITNKGVEISLNLRPYTARNASWDIGLQYGKNNNKVESLLGIDAVDLNTGGFFTGAVGAAVVGSRVGVLRGQDFARCGNGTILDDGTNVDALCGSSAPKGALFIAANGFPTVDPVVRVIADGNPRWTGSARSSLNLFRSLTISGLVDIKRGGENWNGTKGALYNFGTHADTENRGGSFIFGTNYMPAQPGGSGAVAGPGAGKTVVIGQSWYQGDGSGFGSVSRQFVEDASYVKLREISIGYTITSPGITGGLGFSSIDLRLAGRNLKTWTNYTGVDPETNLGGAAVAIRGIDYFNNPQTKSFVFSIGLNR